MFELLKKEIANHMSPASLYEYNIFTTIYEHKH